MHKELADSEFPIREKAPRKEYYEWTNKDTGEIYRVPKGIDPGWDYNPGEAAWGRKLSQDVMSKWRAQGTKAWERLTPGDWETYGRPERIRIDEPRAKIGPMLASKAALRSELERILGAKERVFSFRSGQFRYDILANAETLAEHVPLDRSAFVPFIREALEEPFEVWLSFERHKGTGKYELRQRTVKAVRLDRQRAIVMVAQVRSGIMEAWTMIPTSKLGYANNQRAGKLIWARE
ncbi:MAG: hypothetical protein JRJ66_02140 [Deltaproteobacteria bacterium]|nr:hypothetical protein [Deltaproteobacteria bacterium]